MPSLLCRHIRKQCEDQALPSRGCPCSWARPTPLRQLDPLMELNIITGLGPALGMAVYTPNLHGALRPLLAVLWSHRTSGRPVTAPGPTAGPWHGWFSPPPTAPSCPHPAEIRWASWRVVTKATLSLDYRGPAQFCNTLERLIIPGGIRKF